ncbi:hypothetical protein IL086_002958, partial [Enterococcus faecalis]|nr:hypothetical protein [Enterococcus faecalis]
MKKIVSILLMVVAVFTLTACNGSKLDKTGEEFKKTIITENSDLDNKDYKESDFSFLIYKDKDTNRYLAEAWIPYEGKSNDIEEKYLYNENKKLELEPFDGNSFDYVKSQGNYEVVYKSG